MNISGDIPLKMGCPVFRIAAICAGLLMMSCGKGDSGADSAVKFQQYFIQGETLFNVHCSNCHQKDGSGLGRVYPPLNESDFMENNLDEVVCLIRHGRSGELVVNGKNYNQPMPGLTSLTDLEIAEITTYIYNSWSHKRGLVDVKTVSAILEKCER